MAGKKDKKNKQKLWFIEIKGDPGATKSEAAKKSMKLIASHLQNIKKKPKNLF